VTRGVAFQVEESKLPTIADEIAGMVRGTLIAAGGFSVLLPPLAPVDLEDTKEDGEDG